MLKLTTGGRPYPCIVFEYRRGAVDGSQTPCLAPFGDHEEGNTDKKANCSMMLLAISDTMRIVYFVRGFPGSRGDCSTFRSRAWYKAMLLGDSPRWPLLPGEIILGDCGFSLSCLVVRDN